MRREPLLHVAPLGGRPADGAGRRRAAAGLPRQRGPGPGALRSGTADRSARPAAAPGLPQPLPGRLPAGRERAVRVQRRGAGERLPLLRPAAVPLAALAAAAGTVQAESLRTVGGRRGGQGSSDAAAAPRCPRGFLGMHRASQGLPGLLAPGHARLRARRGRRGRGPQESLGHPAPERRGRRRRGPAGGRLEAEGGHRDDDEGGKHSHKPGKRRHPDSEGAAQRKASGARAPQKRDRPGPPRC
mmetsp:Transcript_19882/g.59992  ORF Transcript_19882/g.59992 Transcript_19882/m.59992 type:complete len:243 (+) Transcript_19882:343-1071(+)